MKSSDFYTGREKERWRENTYLWVNSSFRVFFPFWRERQRMREERERERLEKRGERREERETKERERGEREREFISIVCVRKS